VLLQRPRILTLPSAADSAYVVNAVVLDAQLRPAVLPGPVCTQCCTPAGCCPLPVNAALGLRRCAEPRRRVHAQLLCSLRQRRDGSTVFRASCAGDGVHEHGLAEHVFGKVTMGCCCRAMCAAVTLCRPVCGCVLRTALPPGRSCRRAFLS
jgi:hypothetical protein